MPNSNNDTFFFFIIFLKQLLNNFKKSKKKNLYQFLVLEDSDLNFNTIKFKDLSKKNESLIVVTFDILFFLRIKEVITCFYLFNLFSLRGCDCPRSYPECCFSKFLFFLLYL